MLTADAPGRRHHARPANIRNQVITFLIAGHETTSGALSFALYYLAKHPAALRLVQREVGRAVGRRSATPSPTFERGRHG